MKHYVLVISIVLWLQTNTISATSINTENVKSNILSSAANETVEEKLPELATTCDPLKCQLPDCYCGDGIPGGLSPEETPQFVLLTFDDAINPQVKEFFNKIFGVNGRKRRNPDGCSIKATFYVSHENTLYSIVQDLYSDGHEIATHTISHSQANRKKEFDEERWRAEIVGQKEMLTRYGGVDPRDIGGIRFPFLEVDGDESFNVLEENKFMYDSSLPSRKPMWPYTLNHVKPGQCQIPPCPKYVHKNLWEIPLSLTKGVARSYCNMWDKCQRPDDIKHKQKTKYYIRNMFMLNFEEYYTGKDLNGKPNNYHRTPFPLFWHAATFIAEDVKDEHYNSLEDGFLKFIDAILERDDVFFVTSQQLLQWIKNPKPLSEMRKKKRKQECRSPFQGNARHCTGTKREYQCNEFENQQWRTCQHPRTCPDSFPSLYNIDGRNGTYQNYETIFGN